MEKMACTVQQKPTVNDETESIDSERCFEEMYKGDSRNWLIRDASAKKPRPPLVSTMRAEYEVPNLEERRVIGKRRAILQQKFFDEVAEQVIQESKEPPPIEKYCTTYDVMFQIEGFAPVKKTYGQNPELYVKYPLYSDLPMSYWQFKYSNRNGLPSSALGQLTATPDLKNPFKRNSEFSKPVGEVLDTCLL